MIFQFSHQHHHFFLAKSQFIPFFPHSHHPFLMLKSSQWISHDEIFLDSQEGSPFVIITGFVCSTMSGRPTTLKRSGSDYSVAWKSEEIMEIPPFLVKMSWGNWDFMLEKPCDLSWEIGIKYGI